MSALEVGPESIKTRPTLQVVVGSKDQWLANDLGSTASGVRYIQSAPSQVELRRTMSRHPSVTAREYSRVPLGQQTSMGKQTPRFLQAPVGVAGSLLGVSNVGKQVPVGVAGSLSGVGFAGKRVPVITPVPVTEKKSVHCASIWKTIAKVIGYVIALVLVTLVGIGIGTALGPGSYSGSITEHIVSEGDSIWQLAANVDTTISVENVMEDIRSINALESDSLQVGQSIFLPTY